MRDPRKQSRVALEQPVILCTDWQGHHPKAGANVLDLSKNGLGFETEAELKRGDLLFLKLNLPITVACQVRSVKARGEGYRCGARIEKIGLLDKLKLNRFLKAQQKTGGANNASR
ncbi:MAG: PilZ domain-containing protein [Elusimicrobia bacterium]|nr:PilZ domain-containing protein [Elusimicrobiota bacterium]